MNSKKKSMKTRFSEGDIDKIVESQAEEDSAWERPIKVRRAKINRSISAGRVSCSCCVPSEIAQREKCWRMVVAHY